MAAHEEVEERSGETSRPELLQGYTFPIDTVEELERLNAKLDSDTVRRRLVSKCQILSSEQGFI